MEPVFILERAWRSARWERVLERDELETSPNPGVCVFRVLAIHRHIVLGTHVVCDVVIHDQPRQSFEIEEFE